MTPLEAFNKVLEIICNQRHDDNLQNYIVIIETALKRLAYQDTIIGCALNEEDRIKFEKQLKALEIIKEKTNLTKTNDGKKALVFVILETQEEYDLLKEVLL